MSIRPHGISASDHDRAYRSLGRWALVAGLGTVGAWLCLGAARDVVDGLARRDTLATCAGGLVLLGLALLFTAPGRSGQPPALQGEGGVLVPVRRLPLVAGWVVVVLLPPLYVLMGPPGLPGRRSEAMWPFVVVGIPVVCAWLAWRLLRCDLRLRLDPDGVSIPSFWRDEVERVPWDLVEQVLSRRRFRPELVLVLATDGDELSFTTIDLRLPRWRATLLAEVLTHYAEDPAARSDLLDAAAVDRFRVLRDGGSGRQRRTAVPAVGPPPPGPAAPGAPG